MTVVEVLVGVIASVAIAWALFILALIIFRPRGMSFEAAKRLVPDIVRLVRDLARDPAVSRKVRRRLSALLVYIALPIDIIPDFLPVIGYADDVIVLAIVLRSVVRSAGPAALDRHWQGTPEGLALVRRLCRADAGSDDGVVRGG